MLMLKPTAPKNTPKKSNQSLKKLPSSGPGALVPLASIGLLIFAVDALGFTLPSAFHFKNWGLMNDRNASHIHIPEAWKIESGSKNVVVGVIDTGIDPNHKDLKANLWQDPSQARAPGAQEKDKVYGWNFVTNKPNPSDEHGHGTHVAGIIGAVADPKSGVSGVTQKVSIMAVKYYSDANPGSVNLRNTIKAIDYAVEKGAKIINYSGGGPEFSEEEYLAIKKAEARGILVVAAAGNEHQNTDTPENHYYPAAYRLSNILVVSATDINNNILPSSNWGKSYVDVAAPGENIFSTLPGGKYGYMTGTSQATAFVSGVAALLLSHDPSLKPAQLRELIMSSVDPISGLKEKLKSGGRVNAYRALLALESKGKTFPTKKPELLVLKPVSLLNLFEIN